MSSPCVESPLLGVTPRLTALPSRKHRSCSLVYPTSAARTSLHLCHDDDIKGTFDIRNKTEEAVRQDCSGAQSSPAINAGPFTVFRSSFWSLRIRFDTSSISSFSLCFFFGSNLGGLLDLRVTGAIIAFPVVFVMLPAVARPFAPVLTVPFTTFLLFRTVPLAIFPESLPVPLAAFLANLVVPLAVFLVILPVPTTVFLTSLPDLPSSFFPFLKAPVLSSSSLSVDISLTELSSSKSKYSSSSSDSSSRYSSASSSSASPSSSSSTTSLSSLLEALWLIVLFPGDSTEFNPFISGLSLSEL
mmetsp:Transcript_36953/g.89679  ORF Transcript_36953/g.89679 Transcript_36953/m.89679 type:complete len:301 (+) Transcript_36953:1419-2321(+)